MKSCLHDFLSKVGLWLQPAGNCNAPTFGEENVKSFQGRIELSHWSSSGQWEISACRQPASKPFNVLSLQSFPLGAGGEFNQRHFADFLVCNFQEFCSVIWSICASFGRVHPSFKTRLAVQGRVDVRRVRGAGLTLEAPLLQPPAPSSPHPPSSRASNPQQSSGEGGYQQLDTSIILLVELMVHVAAPTS